MQINPITSYNQRININNQPKQVKSNTSFRSIKAEGINLKYYFSSPKLAKPFVEAVKKLEAEKLNLREIVDVSKLSSTGKIVFKDFLSRLKEEEIQDYPIKLELKYDMSNYIARLSENFFNGEYLVDYAYYDEVERFETGNTRNIYLRTNIDLIKSRLNNHILDACEERAKIREKRAAKERENKSFADLQSLLDTKPEKTDIAKAIKVPADDLLPVSSVVCTFDDINNYLIEHMAELGGGRIFNKTITKDGESLLIALAHVQPDKDNIDSYIKLVKSMLKMPFIDYNQKDSMDIPFIAHVLNSQNKILFAAVTGCKDLKYDPSLEFEFNSITDPEFKELVLKTPIFENAQNKEFKTIFVKPNPMYK